jgi:precorrin-6B methylase 2
MIEEQFIANLSSTFADIRKLNVKKIELAGQDISELIGTGGGSGSVTIKHANDTRETVT